MIIACLDKNIQLEGATRFLCCIQDKRIYDIVCYKKEREKGFEKTGF